jgi:predicted O-linked N-acetylglucosamine transferase (SPINDLY family)
MAAAARNIDGERLVFADRMPLADHLARIKVADLFLDTLPYNAHTTGSDALWAGVPMITQAGSAFAGRVAASLLRAVGMSELITSNKSEYEKLAISFARHPAKLAEIRQKLAANRLHAPLFDTPRFARHLEDAYVQMLERHRAGLSPDHIAL